MKQCSKCKEIKSLSKFSKYKSNKDGYRSICKFCQKKYRLEHKTEIAKYRQEHKVERTKYYQEHKLEIAEYYQDHKAKKAEYDIKYRQEHKVERAKYYQEHKKQIAEHYQERKTEIAKYRQEHKTEKALYNVKYRQNNPDKINARNAKRRASKLKQISSTANLNKIAKFYSKAQKLSKDTGIKMHVDHIIPLSKGGLHHENNLQIITATQNLRKSNKIC